MASSRTERSSIAPRLALTSACGSSEMLCLPDPADLTSPTTAPRLALLDAGRCSRFEGGNASSAPWAVRSWEASTRSAPLRPESASSCATRSADDDRCPPDLG